ncbi:hypothetical protein M9434_002190 [Picochlorum sp. BPE23]|nr:hypothetical protein M9434_002190 [Picochlorum sp. BPE23]
MSQSVFQPIGQKRLTNVAVVRYKKFGKRFEIACYKNKILNWRNGIEKDLDEVLQTTTVFSNVSKGVLAKREDLIQVFGTDDEQTICIKILADGEMQVSDKERKVELDTLFRDVAAILSEKCVNPKSKKPYTIGVLERALKDIHFSVDPKKPAKLQAVEALPLLKAVFPIERAQMQLKITIPVSSFQDLEKILKEHHAAVMEQNIEDDGVVVECCIDPGAYRKIHGFVQDEGQHGRLEVVSLNAFVEGPHDDSAEDVVESLENLSLPAEAAVPSEPERPRIVAPVQTLSASEQTVVFQRGPIADIPDEFASRRDRFSEIDELQPGWTVQLKQKGNGSVVDAVFFSPSGEKVGSYAVARRMALAYHKKA